MAELRAFPTLLHVHLNHPPDALMSSPSLLTQERRNPFRLDIITRGVCVVRAGARQTSSYIFRGDSACISPDSVSGLRRHCVTATRQLCLEFLGIGNDP